MVKQARGTNRSVRQRAGVDLSKEGRIIKRSDVGRQSELLRESSEQLGAPHAELSHRPAPHKRATPCENAGYGFDSAFPNEPLQTIP